MAERAARIDRVMADWLERQSDGTAEEPALLIESHPDLSAELRKRFAALELLEAVRLERAGAPISLPERIDEYDIVRVIGRGGMGVVFEAEQASMGRRVALKVLPPDLTTSHAAVERFLREARAAGRLEHPNIVPVYAVGQEAGQWFFSMGLVDGRPLDESLDALRAETGRREAARPEYLRRTAELFAGAADALHLAHEQGVIHRDVKPSNLMLAEDGTLKVLDFGLARLEGDGRGVTRTGRIVGTPAYMSPEQAGAGSLPVDRRTDVYSLGAALYEALTLGQLFDARDVRQLYAQILQHEPRPPRRLNPAVPKDLEAIVLKALEKAPHRRYATAAELAADLCRFVAGETVHARRLGAAGRAMRACMRHKARTALVAAVVLLGVAGWVLSTEASARQARRLAAAYDDLCAQADVASSGAAFALPQGGLARTMESLESGGRERGASALALCTEAIALLPDRPEAYVRRALAAGVPDVERLLDLNRAREHGVHPRTYHLARAQILSAMGREAEAGAEREHAADHRVESALDHYFEARLASASGRVEEAIDLVTHAMERAGEDRKLFMHALRLRAGLLEALESTNDALGDLLTLQRLGDDSITLAVRIAAGWMRMSRYDILEHTQARTVERVRASGKLEHWLELLVALRTNDQGRFHAELIREAMDAHPNSSRLRIERVYSAIKRRDHDAALRRALAVVEERSRDPSAWFALVKAHFHAERWEELVSAAAKTLEVDPSHARALELQGQALRILGRYEEALPVFRESLRLAPWSLTGWGRLAECHRELKDWPAVERAARRGLAIKPQSKSCFELLCDALEQQGRQEGAFAATRALLERLQRIAGSYAARSWMHYYLGQYEEAHAEARKAGPHRWRPARAVKCVRINSLRKLGQFDEALRVGRLAVRDYPDTRSIRRAFLGALLDAGRVEEGRAHLLWLLCMDPGHEETLALKARWDALAAK